MKQEERIVCYDNDLQIEAHHFKGIMQKFPNHFHEYYVIGFIESGQRRLSCKNKEYIIGTGDVLMFNPLDNHACEQIDYKTLDYRSINIKVEVMKKLVKEIGGSEYLPCFTTPVAYRSEEVELLKELHKMIMENEKDFGKEEVCYLLMEQLIEKYAKPHGEIKPEAINIEIERICEYLESHLSDRIKLDNLSSLSNMNKYSLLRSFTKIKGITPYRYLETIRVNKAKRLLEIGMEPLEVAIQTGFSDQSHFTNFFKKIIGLTPKQYQNIFIEADQEEKYDR